MEERVTTDDRVWTLGRETTEYGAWRGVIPHFKECFLEELDLIQRIEQKHYCNKDAFCLLIDHMGDPWQGVGMHGRGACMVGGTCMAGGCAWQGACMTGGMCGSGMHCRGAGVAGRDKKWTKWQMRVKILPCRKICGQ